MPHTPLHAPMHPPPVALVNPLHSHSPSRDPSIDPSPLADCTKTCNESGREVLREPGPGAGRFALSCCFSLASSPQVTCRSAQIRRLVHYVGRAAGRNFQPAGDPQASSQASS
jgi:hypothetical protein